MSGPQPPGIGNLPGTRARSADQACDRFESAWKAGQHPRIEDHLAAVPEPERLPLLHELILLEIDYRRLAGEELHAEEFLARFPALERTWIVDVLASSGLPPTRLHGDTADPSAVPRRLGK